MALVCASLFSHYYYIPWEGRQKSKLVEELFYVFLKTDFRLSFFFRLLALKVQMQRHKH